MPLPKKATKEYLKIRKEGGKLVLVADKKHAAELAPLFQQRGLPCRNESGGSPEKDRLVFSRDVDRTAAAQILQEYKTANA